LGGYSKPAGPEAAGSGGYSKPTGAVPSGKFSGGSTFDKTGMEAEKKARAQASLERYKAEQGKFKAPEYKVEGASQHPLADKAKVYSRFDYGNHYSARDGFYRSSGYVPPAYAFNSSPGFGMFDALFLYWMLDHISNKNVAATAYHHADDPGFKKWREEAERQAKDNPDLKAKLEEMDKQIKSLQGTPKDPAYIPPGVPPEAVLAPSVLASKKAEKPKLRFATGQAGGWYDKFGDLFKKEGKNLDTVVINTAGSLDNMKLLANGEADLAVIQSDALALWEKKYPEKVFMTEQASLYEEYVQLVANRRSGVSSLRDLDPRRHVIYVGPSGSGTSLTWAALCEYAPKLKKIPVKNAPYDEALQETVKNPHALMLFVGALRSDFLKKAESVAAKSENLRLVEIDEPLLKNLKDRNGNPVYKVGEIPASVYPNLQRGWFFSSSVKTVSVTAVLALRTQWAEKFGPEAMDALSVTVLETKPVIEKRVAEKS
jgi:TRAP transporter TAXI family solute receptor